MCSTDLCSTAVTTETRFAITSDLASQPDVCVCHNIHSHHTCVQEKWVKSFKKCYCKRIAGLSAKASGFIQALYREHAHLNSDVHLSVCVCLSVFVCLSVYACGHRCMCVFVCVRRYWYLCVYVSMWIPFFVPMQYVVALQKFVNRDDIVGSIFRILYYTSVTCSTSSSSSESMSATSSSSSPVAGEVVRCPPRVSSVCLSPHKTMTGDRYTAEDSLHSPHLGHTSVYTTPPPPAVLWRRRHQQQHAASVTMATNSDQQPHQAGVDTMSSSIAENKEYAIRPVSLRWLFRQRFFLFLFLLSLLSFVSTPSLSLFLLSLFGVAMVTVYLSHCHCPGVTTEHIGRQK